MHCSIPHQIGSHPDPRLVNPGNTGAPVHVESARKAAEGARNIMYILTFIEGEENVPSM